MENTSEVQPVGRYCRRAGDRHGPIPFIPGFRVTPSGRIVTSQGKVLCYRGDRYPNPRWDNSRWDSRVR